MFYFQKLGKITFSTLHLVNEAFTIKMSLLNNENERWKTFDCWSLPYPDPKLMAAVGLFYTGEGDLTKCFFCHIEIMNWKQAEHLRWSNNCPLMRRCITNNKPIN